MTPKHPYNPRRDIGTPTIQEIGLPKSYSTRTFVATFKADPDLWSRFKTGCAERGVSICHVLEALMEAWLQGQKAEATLVRPVVVNLNMQHVVHRPRRMKKFQDVIYETSRKIWPPNCQNADDFIKSTKEVGCLKSRQWIPLAKCWRCFIFEGSRLADLEAGI